jgi:hypothetical protein
VISKALVTVTSNGSVANKNYDGSTQATLTSNPTVIVSFGNSSSPNGVTTNSSFTGFTTVAEFSSGSPGTQNVNIKDTLTDSSNFTFANNSNVWTGTYKATITDLIKNTTDGSLVSAIYQDFGANNFYLYNQILSIYRNVYKNPPIFIVGEALVFNAKDTTDYSFKYTYPQEKYNFDQIFSKNYFYEKINYQCLQSDVKLPLNVFLMPTICK